MESLQSQWRALGANLDVAPADDRATRPPRGRGAGGDSRGGNDDRRRERPRPARSAHPLEATFEAASARVTAAQQRAESAREAQQLQTIAEAGRLLDDYATASGAERDRLQEAFAALSLPGDAQQPLSARMQSMSSADGNADASEAGAEAERLAVRAELAAGLESPAESEVIRREEQMQRLAAKLSGQLDPDNDANARALLIALESLNGVTAGKRASLRHRVLAACSRIKGR